MRVRVTQYQIKTSLVYVSTAAAPTVSDIKWFSPFSEPVRTKPRLIAAANVAFVNNINPIVSFSWFGGLSEPKKFKKRLMESLHQYHAIYPNPLVSFGWFAGLSEPKRFPPTAHPFGSPSFTTSPLPYVTFSYFNALSEPKRFPPRLSESLQQSLAFVWSPTTIKVDWFNWLSEPKRFRPALHESQQRWLFYHPQLPPFDVSWHMPLAEPIVKEKLWLKSSLQQYLAHPPRLLPTPVVTGTMAATETADTFLAGGLMWNRVSLINWDISEIVPMSARAGIYENTQVSVNFVTSETLPTPSSGSPTTSSITAHVSIIEIRA